jgi:hypothetical protein
MADYISFQPSDYFTSKLYTGNASSSHAITGVGFQPDWVWIKGRSIAESHRIYDVVRGAANHISSNANVAEGSLYPLTSFDSDGFTIGSSDGSVNGSYNYVAWNWKANGSPSSNSNGDLTSSVSVNTTTGISIGTYTSDITGVGSKTVGHGLGKTPKLIITKNRDQAGQRWGVQAPSILTADHILELNTTASQTNMSGNGSLSTVSSTVFSVNYADGVGNATGSGNYIFYAFAEIQGFSKIGSFVGNGSTWGTFVNCGFKPMWILVKRTSDVEDWFMYDTKRDPINVADTRLKANASSSEATLSGVDILSNGFKWRSNTAGLNASGSTYIYMAFAEEPFVASNETPAVAR